MKKLLIIMILLLSSVCYGQDNVKHFSWYNDKSPTGLLSTGEIYNLPTIGDTVYLSGERSILRKNIVSVNGKRKEEGVGLLEKKGMRATKTHMVFPPLSTIEIIKYKARRDGAYLTVIFPEKINNSKYRVDYRKANRMGDRIKYTDLEIVLFIPRGVLSSSQ